MGDAGTRSGEAALQVCSLNVGDAENAWLAFADLAADRLDVLAFQEVNMTEMEAARFARAADGRGYLAFGTTASSRHVRSM